MLWWCPAESVFITMLSLHVCKTPAQTSCPTVQSGSKSAQPENAKIQFIRAMWWGRSGIGKVRVIIEARWSVSSVPSLVNKPFTSAIYQLQHLWNSCVVLKQYITASSQVSFFDNSYQRTHCERSAVIYHTADLCIFNLIVLVNCAVYNLTTCSTNTS